MRLVSISLAFLILSLAVLVAAATGLADFIGVRGGDVDSIYGSCGVSPTMSTLPTLKLPLATFCNLLEKSAERTGFDNFGLCFGQQFQPRDLGMWGYAALSSPTLGSALENLVELFPFQQSASTMRLHVDDARRVRLEYRIEAPAIVARRQDAFSRDRIGACRAVMRTPRPVGQGRQRPGVGLAPQPLMARLSTDAEGPTPRRDGVALSPHRENEMQPLIAHIGLQPRHGALRSTETLP